MSMITTIEKWQFTKTVFIKGKEDNSQSVNNKDLTLEEAKQYLHEADLQVLKDWGMEAEYKGDAKQHRVSVTEPYQQIEMVAYIEPMQ